MFVVRTKYPRQGSGVVGKAFDTEREAEMMLEMRGWRRDPHNRGPHGERSWEKAGPTRMVGMIGVCMSEYVYIAEE